MGLAQCGAVLNAKVKSSLAHAIESGAISPSDLASLSNARGLASLQSISELPPALQDAVKGAFREGTRWAFISLIPWAAVAVFLSIFLSNISEPQARTDPPATEEKHGMAQLPRESAS